MARKTKYIFEDTENIYSQQKQDEKTWSDIQDQAQDVFKNWIKYTDGTSGVKAKSWQDSGRGCPRCGGVLTYVEVTDSGAILLECHSCHRQIFNTDIEPYTQKELKQMKKEAKEAGATAVHNTPDELYRLIPDALILEYVNMRKNRN